MYCIDVEIVTGLRKFEILFKAIYCAHYQVNTRFFRILINLTVWFYISEYERISVCYNCSN